MFDTSRLDTRGGFQKAPGLQTASLDEVLCIAAS
jgi:hypothetical protein